MRLAVPLAKGARNQVKGMELILAPKLELLERGCLTLEKPASQEHEEVVKNIRHLGGVHEIA